MKAAKKREKKRKRGKRRKKVNEVKGDVEGNFNNDKVIINYIERQKRVKFSSLLFTPSGKNLWEEGILSQCLNKRSRKKEGHEEKTKKNKKMKKKNERQEAAAASHTFHTLPFFLLCHVSHSRVKLLDNRKRRGGDRVE